MGWFFLAQSSLESPKFLDEVSAAIVEGLSAYLVVLVCSTLLGSWMWAKAQGKTGTFVMITSLFMGIFVLGFYGTFFVANYFFPQVQLSTEQLTFIGISISLIPILILYYPLKIRYSEEVSFLQKEFDELKDEDMSPLDRHRKEYMAKKRKNRV